MRRDAAYYYSLESSTIEILPLSAFINFHNFRITLCLIEILSKLHMLEVQLDKERPNH